MACESIDTLNNFKLEFLTRFEGTGANRSINFRQAVYERKILQLNGAWDQPAVKRPMEAGVRLSTAD
eukprot:20481-Rhodomonas_salina.2